MKRLLKAMKQVLGAVYRVLFQNRCATACARIYNAWIEWTAVAMTSPPFVGIFFGTIVVWIAWNVATPWVFDKPPFMGLNLVMSALAGIQATAVAIAARRIALRSAAEEERRRKHDEAVMERLVALEEGGKRDRKEILDEVRALRAAICPGFAYATGGTQ